MFMNTSTGGKAGIFAELAVIAKKIPGKVKIYVGIMRNYILIS